MLGVLGGDQRNIYKIYAFKYKVVCIENLQDYNFLLCFVSSLIKKKNLFILFIFACCRCSMSRIIFLYLNKKKTQLKHLR